MSRIALISPGAMGTAVGRTLLSQGHQILCDVADRSLATRQRAEAAGFVSAMSFDDAVLGADIVLSLVPPSQALPVARRYAASIALDGAAGRRSKRLFVDGNAISPQTAMEIFDAVAGVGARAVDCSIFGPADVLGASNVLVFSGADAASMAALFVPVVETRLAGGRFGDASSVKMALSIMTKALPALFLDAACASAASGQLDVMVSLFERLYPGIMSFIGRSLPTYPRHVARRLDEMREVETWLRELGQMAEMTRSARHNLERLHHAALSGERKWDLLRLLDAVAERGILDERLRAPPSRVPA